MAPLIIQIVTTLAARWFTGWRPAVRIGMAALFTVTAAARVSPLRHELAAMIPPPLTGALWLVDLTGVLELAGAIGLLTPRFRRAAAWSLVALLAALFPANVYAALNGLTLGSDPATPLAFRAPMQAWWIGCLWWSTIAPAEEPIGRQA
jgi:uncharacterized membrane protein